MSWHSHRNQQDQVIAYAADLRDAWLALSESEDDPRAILTRHYTAEQITAVCVAGKFPEYEIRNGALYETTGIVPPRPSIYDLMAAQASNLFASFVDGVDPLLGELQLKYAMPEPTPPVDPETRLLTAQKITAAFQMPLEMAYPERFVYVPIKRSIWYRLNEQRRTYVWAIRRTLGNRLLGYDRDDDDV